VIAEEPVIAEELALVPMELPVIQEELDDMPPVIETHEIGYKAKYEELCEMYDTLKAKYDELLNKPRAVREKTVPKYYIELGGDAYTADKLADTKNDGVKVPERLSGVKVSKGKCGCLIEYSFTVEKYDKKGILPLVVKDTNTGQMYKNAGGAIEVSTKDEVFRVYLLKNVVKC